MNNPKISVVMSVYNGAKYLPQSIESILNQTFRDFEFIIINDGSSDCSKEIIKKYQNQDKRIVLIDNEVNLGLTKSLNKGIRISRGKYIARQDADDISMETRLSKQYDFLEKNPEIFLCGANFDYIDEEGRIIITQKNRLVFDEVGIRQTLIKENCFLHSSIIFRNENIFYREKFYCTQDYDLYLNLLTSGKKMVNLREKLLLWRFSRNAISNRHSIKQRAFTKWTKLFYKQRMQYGYDEYNKFDEKDILKMQNKKHPALIQYEDKLQFLLKSNNFNKAKEFFYKNYLKLPKKNFINTAAFYIFVHKPAIYKTYRKIVYKDE